jgi:hypothetical protein
MYINNNSAYSDYDTHSFGIDKIHLHTTDYEVLNTLQLEIVPNKKRQGQKAIENTLLFTSNNERVWGSKAFHNSRDNRIQLSLNRYGAFVVFNPSKFNDNKLVSDSSKLNDIGLSVEDYLASMGLRMDIGKSSLSRVDLAKDRRMNKLVRDYNNTFETLSMKRATKQKFYPTGFMIGNNQRMNVAYDREKLSNKTDSRIMRLEHQSKTSKEVSRVFGVKTLQGFNSLSEGDIKAIYNVKVLDNLINVNNDIIPIDTPITNVASLLTELKDSDRFFMQKAMLICGGATGIVESSGGIDNLRSILKNIGLSRQAASKQIQQIQSYIKAAPSFLKHSVKDDLEEIRTKFTA